MLVWCIVDKWDEENRYYKLEWREGEWYGYYGAGGQWMEFSTPTPYLMLVKTNRCNVNSELLAEPPSEFS